MAKVIFEELFEKSGDPNMNRIIYKGKELVCVDWFEMQSETEDFVLEIEKTDSDYLQAIELKIPKEDGKFEINGIKHHHMILWEDTVDGVVYIRATSKKKKFVVYNAWAYRYKLSESQHNGAAMWVEEIPGGKRYHCNDGQQNDDLNDIVFTIKRAEK